MRPGSRYMLTIKIKLHTSPLKTLEYEREGKFVKESQSYFIFDGFRVRKANVINIHAL